MLVMSRACSAAQELYLFLKFCALLSAVRCFALGARRDDSFATSVSDSAHIAFIDPAYENIASKVPTFRILSAVEMEHLLFPVEEVGSNKSKYKDLSDRLDLLE